MAKAYSEDLVYTDTEDGLVLEGVVMPYDIDCLFRKTRVCMYNRPPIRVWHGMASVTITGGTATRRLAMRTAVVYS